MIDTARALDNMDQIIRHFQKAGLETLEEYAQEVIDYLSAPRRDTLQPTRVDQELMKARGLDIAVTMVEGYVGEKFSPERRAAWTAWYAEWSEEMARRAQVMASPVSD